MNPPISARQPQLADLVNMESPAAVFEEVKRNYVLHYDIADFPDVRRTFNDFIMLMEGRYPGYRACNTRFHDKLHTTDALLAISRILDGWNLEHPALPERTARLALMATILHDSGYVQAEQDTEGTGAKYTMGHIERSIGFMQQHLRGLGYGEPDLAAAACMVRCTGFSTKIADIRFPDEATRTAGLMLGAADLVGQMSSRTYLERLVFLYHEFQEGNIPGYPTEQDLFRKTLLFYEQVQRRLSQEFNGIQRTLRNHFRERYRIDQDLCAEAMHRQMEYLDRVLTTEPGAYRSRLRRRVPQV
jgi:hypothetical protein